MKTNTNMSVFNKYTDNNKNVVFKKHLIQSVFWDDSKGINRNKGYENSDAVNVFIPKCQNNMSNYVKPKNYKGSGDTWTLENGDFIVKGDVTETKVQSIKELTMKYDNVFTISLVDDKDFGSPLMHHFEIRGK